MKTSPRFIDSGSTLMVVVLVTMLVLAGLVMVTSNLALSSRRSTAEQKSIIPAQLAAESGIAYAKSKLDIAYDILSQSKVPDGSIRFGDAKKALSDLCPQPVIVPAPHYNDQKGAIKVNDTSITVRNAVRLCDFPEDHKFQKEQAHLFVLATPNPTDPTENRYTRNGLGSQDNDKNKLFQDLFLYNEYTNINNSVSNNTKVKSGLRPLSLLQTGENEYSLYFRVAGVDSLGEAGNAQRRITSGSNESVGMIRVKYKTDTPTTTTPPKNDNEVNFSEFSYFAHEFKPEYLTLGSNHRFTGRVHSNTPLAWKNGSTPVDRGVYASAQIGGRLSSSTCDIVKIERAPNGDRKDICYTGRRGAGYYAGSWGNGGSFERQFTKIKDSVNFTSQSGYNGKYDIYSNKSRPGDGLNLLVEKGQPTPDLNAKFIKFPINDTTQQSAATTSGIVLNNPLRVKLEVDGSGDSAIQKIIITDKSEKTYTLSYGKDKIMYIDTGSGRQKAKKTSGSPGWVADPGADDTFNGVIYTTGELASLTGPERRNVSDPNSAAPAIAKFSNINVVASGDINLTGDLKYEVRCTEIQPCIDAQGHRTADNMLGIYSTNGYVSPMLMKGDSRQITASSSRNRLKLNAPPNLELDAFVMTAKDEKGYFVGAFMPRYVDSNGKEQLTSKGARKLDHRWCRCNRGTVVIRGGLIVASTRATQSDGSGFDFRIEYDKRGSNYSPAHFPTGSVDGKGGGNGNTGNNASSSAAPAPVTDNTKLTNWSIIFAKVDNTTGKPVEQDGVFAKPDFSLDKEILQEKVPAQTNTPTGGN